MTPLLDSPSTLSPLPMPAHASFADYEAFQPSSGNYNEQPMLNDLASEARAQFSAMLSRPAASPATPSGPGPLGEALKSPHSLARERPSSAAHGIGLHRQIAANLNYNPLLDPLSPVDTPRPSYAQLDNVFQHVNLQHSQVSWPFAAKLASNLMATYCAHRVAILPGRLRRHNLSALDCVRCCLGRR